VSDPTTAPLRRWGMAVTVALLAVTALKLLIAWRTVGTNDVHQFEGFIPWMRAFGADMYALKWDMNHPPSVLHYVLGLGALTDASGLPFPFWFRVGPALADVAVVALLWQVLVRPTGDPRAAAAVLITALSPVALMVSGFHGNTDALLALAMLLAAVATERERPVAAGLAWGLAMSIKVVPLVILPALWLGQRDWSARGRFTLAAGGAVLLLWSPYLWQQPVEILSNVFGYRSLGGIWGLPYLFAQVAPVGSDLRAAVDRVPGLGAPLLLLTIGVAALGVHLLVRPRPRVLVQVGLSLCLFLVGASGFGVQYLLWLLPFLVLLGPGLLLVWHVVAGSFLFAVYDFWSVGLPWYSADSNLLGPWPSSVAPLQLAAWGMTVIALAAFGRRALTGDAAAVAWGRARRWVPSLVAAVVVLSSVGWAAQLARAHRADATRKAFVGPAPMPVIRAEPHVRVARALAARGRSDEALASVDRAIALAPAWPEARTARIGLLLAAGRYADAEAERRTRDALPPLSPAAAARWYRP
jgi:hypothetical protein